MRAKVDRYHTWVLVVGVVVGLYLGIAGEGEVDKGVRQVPGVVTAFATFSLIGHDMFRPAQKIRAKDKGVGEEGDGGEKVVVVGDEKV